MTKLPVELAHTPVGDQTDRDTRLFARRKFSRELSSGTPLLAKKGGRGALGILEVAVGDRPTPVNEFEFLRGEIFFQPMLMYSLAVTGFHAIVRINNRGLYC